MLDIFIFLRGRKRPPSSTIMWRRQSVGGRDAPRLYGYRLQLNRSFAAAPTKAIQCFSP